MCGIFGYVGNQQAAPLLIEGLRTLEYRGYDSAGIMVPGNEPVKAVGPIDNLAAVMPEKLPGTSGIAHTRWATHGAPTHKNAHPHTDMAETVWIAHNGIIENWQEIKEMLSVQGMRFYSETDTEVLAKLIGSYYNGDLTEAVRRALTTVRGTYGLAVISTRQPDTLIVARMGSPIVIGLGDGGNFIASDPSALLPHTKDVVYLEDGELAVVTASTYRVSSLAGKTKEKAPEKVEWDMETVQKDGYEHFMLKEIHEAPSVLEQTLRGRLLIEKGRAKLGGLEGYLPELANLHRLQIVGCGSAYYAGLVGRYMLEEYAGIPVEVEVASEYRYKRTHPDKKSAVLAISQSGETADTRASILKAKEQGLRTLGVVNMVGSSIARETDAGVYNHAGPEVAVASTKAFLSQVTVLALITLLIGRERELSLEEGQAIARDLARLPELARSLLADTTQIEAVAKKYARYENMMFIGRHIHAPIAAEGALKLKEVAYVHAEAYPGGELKHGPLALLSPEFPVLAIVPEDTVFEKMLSNMQEAKARSAPIIALTTTGTVGEVENVANDVIYVPKVHPMLQPILMTIPLQLLAYYAGVGKGYNVDRPRNLAKSVTVE